MARRATPAPPPPPVPDLDPPRKHRRWGLYLPFIAAILAAMLWSGLWLYIHRETRLRMDAGAEALRSAGYQIAWKERRITGYPFRLNVTLLEASIREPSGWALETPRLETESYLHGLGTWVLATPDGFTFVRPGGGPVVVTGDLLHASLSNLDKQPPNVSFEGRKLTFTAGPGAQPFGLTSADKVEAHLRPGPDDQAAVLFRIDNGAARLSSLFARIAGDKPISMIWDSTLTKMSAFKGSDWPTAVKSWNAAGGVMTVRNAGLTAGSAVVGSRAGRLNVGYDGRLAGSLDVTLREAPQALSAMAQTGVIPPEAALAAAAVAAARAGTGDVAQATVTFQAGQTTLGPVAIAPSPKVY